MNVLADIGELPNVNEVFGGLRNEIGDVCTGRGIA